MLETEYAFRILKNGWPRAAKLDPSEAIQVNPPDDGTAYFCLYGELCLNLDDEISAAEALTAASKIDPESLRVIALQARIRGRQGSAPRG